MKVWIIEYYDNRWYKKGQKLKGKVVFDHTTLLREDATFFFHWLTRRRWKHLVWCAPTLRSICQ